MLNVVARELEPMIEVKETIVVEKETSLDLEPGVWLVCDMQTCRHPGITFKFNPLRFLEERNCVEATAESFIRKKWLEEQYRGVFMKKLIDIANQLMEDSEKVPKMDILADHWASIIWREVNVT